MRGLKELRVKNPTGSPRPPDAAGHWRRVEIAGDDLIVLAAAMPPARPLSPPHGSSLAMSALVMARSGRPVKIDDGASSRQLPGFADMMRRLGGDVAG